MRKFITKEITTTSFTIAEITIVKGKPISAVLSTSYTKQGKPTDEKTIREYKRENKIESSRIIVVLSKLETVTTYQLELSKFLELASIKNPIETDETL